MTEADAPLPAGYPQEWEADVVLRDGSVAQLRPITPEDADALHRFHERQSDESIYLRFFAPIKRLSNREVHRFANVDYHSRVALVLMVEDDLVGIARFDRLDAEQGVAAEVAFNVSDHFQGRGVGSVMLEHLAAIGQEQGIERFVADVLPQNRKMLAVFKDAGYEVTQHFDDGVVELAFDIRPTDQSEQVRAEREQRAESLSVKALLAPTSVAVVGVDSHAASVGRQVLSHLVGGGYRGDLYAVADHDLELEGCTTYRSVSELPPMVDLGVIAVSDDDALAATEECVRHGVRSVLVLSNGFAETGTSGQARQQALMRVVRRHGLRIVGPSSFGLINTHPDVALNASLAATMPKHGTLGVFTQSGALGVAMLDLLARRNLGVSDFVSAGNRADVSGNDLMQHWFDDEHTEAVSLYLESVGNPRKFSRIARRLSTQKPVIVVKTDMSANGVPRGHNVRSTKHGAKAFRAMMRQAGVIRVDSAHRMFDVAQLVTTQPLPAGPRVAVVGNADALGVLAADAARSYGLDVTHGPVALPADAVVADYAEALRVAFADPDVDAVITAFIPQLVAADGDIAAAVTATATEHEKPCVATFLGLHGIPEVLTAERADGSVERVPSYSMPEDAVRALRAVTRYSEWLQRDRGHLVNPEGIERARVEALIANVLSDSPQGRRLRPDEVAELLSSYGIDLWPVHPVDNAEEAVAAADQLGYPVALKSVSPLVRHQPVTAFRGDIGGAASVREAYAALDDRLAPLHANRFVVQKMASPGVACVVGSSEDSLFGPVVRFSLSGAPTELLDDVGYRMPPLTTGDVKDLIGSVKAAPLLNGHRGAAPIDHAALEDLLSRVSLLADHHPEIADLELNPVNARPGGTEVLGASVTIAPPEKRADTGRRSLS
ncbi:GNAT family N-acetyltransferase [Demetria terragena]|uniref:bifunctional acetate--CoA ligase family protein/GNAT family N-acetyltransferase n=1 Tax=Demetria terragena TaxID=63959 RepID=UPI00036A917E|nr:GNAT family N-acetyltransferase [Demetria terragena]